MFKNLFNFKKAKTLPEAAMFYVVCAVAYVVVVNAAEMWLAGGL
jgi:hypothetical protein